MRPLTVITGIIAGSCLSIAFSLSAVLILAFILGDEYPRFAHESGDLKAATLLFLSLTAISALSFYTLLIDHWSRWWLQLLMWASLFAVVAYILP